MVRINCKCVFGVKGCLHCSGRGYVDVSVEEFITADKFRQYEEVRESGATNMFDGIMVCELSDNLTRVDVTAIRTHYDKLAELYMTKEK